MLKTERIFQPVWGGPVVKFASSLPELNNYSDGYFYWDEVARTVAAFIVSRRGVVQRGTVSSEQGVVTVQGTVVLPGRAFEYKNTFEFTPDVKMIDRWFQNASGPWRPGHVIELTEKE